MIHIHPYTYIHIFVSTSKKLHLGHTPRHRRIIFSTPAIPTLSCTLQQITSHYCIFMPYNSSTIMLLPSWFTIIIPVDIFHHPTLCRTHSWTPQESWSIYCWRIGSINYCNILSQKEKVYPILHNTPSHPFAIIRNNTDLVCLLFGYNQHLPHHH